MRTPLIMAATQTIKPMQTTRTAVIKTQATAISTETQTNQTQQLMATAIR